MPRKKCKTVYKFDELSDSAKDKAREWYRDGALDDEWWDSSYDRFEDVAKYLGIDLCQKPVKLMNGTTRYDPSIWFSGFSSQGAGACFDGTWRASDVKAEELKADFTEDKELHRLADGFAELAKEYPDATFSVKHTGRYLHSHSTSFDVSLNDPKEEDLEYDSPEWKKAQEQWTADEETLIELARDFMDWIYKSLEQEYDYLNSDEQLDESILANEYEFTEDGYRA